MIKQENPNFLASVYAPNPMEVTYWIDLSEDANGNVIKTYDGKKWIPINNVVENVLTSTSTTTALSSAQGKILNDLITSLTARVQALETPKP